MYFQLIYINTTVPYLGIIGHFAFSPL